MEDSSFGTNPDTGKPLTWDEWKERNPKMGPKLSALLQTWAEVMEDRGLTTLGVKVKLPPATECACPSLFPYLRVERRS